jgi:hypothetical protein
MRYRLRTLMIVLAIGPPLGAGGHWLWQRLRPQPRAWITDEDFPDFVPTGPEFRLSPEAAALKRAQADAVALP